MRKFGIGLLCFGLFNFLLVWYHVINLTTIADRDFPLFFYGLISSMFGAAILNLMEQSE